MDYRGRVILLTGASSGIGRDAALAFSRRGGRVVVVARREERLKALVDECRERGAEAEYLAGDLGCRGFAEGVVHRTAARHGRIDVLVHNAAVPHHKFALRATPEEAEEVMRINFLSCVWTTLAALPVMLRQGGGTIVNVSSFASRVVPPREALYAASKAALNAFSEGLWSDLDGSNIHVGLVHPGAIDTEIWSKLQERHAYTGRKWPPRVVTAAIFEVIEKQRREITVPKTDLRLRVSRFLRLALPSLLWAGMRRMDPVRPEWLEEAGAPPDDATS